jgi:pilus assembly protein Flp/PilA
VNLFLVSLQPAMDDLVRRARSVRVSKEGGASAVEYALLIALIAAVIVVAVWALGQFVLGAFDNTCASISAQRPAGANCGS